MTFSIVAFDADSRQWGVAVASKAMCVGAHVPWGRGSRGAVATQAYHDLRYGWQGLDLLLGGRRADEVVAELTTDDPEARYRQLGIVDAHGAAASFTGEDCMAWAGGMAGKSFAVQGNLLAGPQVPAAMAAAYADASGAFAVRLVTALLAGDEAGGDRRGRQSASVKLWRAEEDVGAGESDVALFLRIDDGELPVHGLLRVTERVTADPLLLCPVGSGR